MFETEEDAQKRLKEFYIPVWENADATVSNAIRIFREKWHSYSSKSKRYNIIKLVRDVIDPAVVKYLSDIPHHYLSFSPVQKRNDNYSKLIRNEGFSYTIDQIHEYLNRFINNSSHTEQDALFIATQDMLISLFMYCEGNTPRKSKISPDLHINTERKTRLCDLCGNLTEFSLFMSVWKENGIIDNEENEDSMKFGKKKRPDYSQIYCLNHRPKLHNGSWNATYKQAKRSEKQFDQEVLRLRRQIAHPDRYNAKSGDNLVDEYFFHLLYDSYFDPTNVPELRNLARRIVDSRLTDNKKRMLVLRKHGLSNREIAIRLGTFLGKTLTNQAISKSLGTIRGEFTL